MLNKKDLINQILIQQERAYLKNKKYCNIICGGQSIDFLSEKEISFIQKSANNIAINKSFMRFNSKYVVFQDFALFEDYISTEKWNKEKYPVLITIRYNKQILKKLYPHFDNVKINNIYNNWDRFINTTGVNKVGNKLLYFNLNLMYDRFVLERDSVTISRGASSTVTAINFAYKMGFENVLLWGLDGFGVHYKDYHYVNGELPRPLGVMQNGFQETLELKRAHHEANFKYYKEIQDLINKNIIKDMKIWNMSKCSRIDCFEKINLKVLKDRL